MALSRNMKIGMWSGVALVFIGSAMIGIKYYNNQRHNKTYKSHGDPVYNLTPDQISSLTQKAANGTITTAEKVVLGINNKKATSGRG